MSADRLCDALTHFVVDVDDEVWSWRVPVILISKNFVRVNDFGDVAVVILSPYLLFKVVDIDVVVTKRY